MTDSEHVGPKPGDIRAALHDAADWVADYLVRVGALPVLARVRPGDIRAALPASPPARGEPLARMLQDFERVIVPGITHWNHPGFFAYFGISGSGPGIVGELLSAALNVNAMLWRTSPAATELEQQVLGWVAQMLGLPSHWFGEINDTASTSTFYALAAAREAAGLDVRNRGMAGRTDLPPMAIYCSAEAHSSVDKAAIALGIGRDFTRRIDTDEAFRMRVDLLERAIEQDLASGVRPIAVVATVGTTSTTSIDPVPDVARLCSRYGLWLHVDAAYGGAAAVVPSHRHVLAGCDQADSLVFNPHKWLLTPSDCSLLFTRRPEALKQAFSLVADYLKTDETGVVNLMDYGLALGRRFRALKLWMVVRAYGTEGLAHMLAQHIEHARWLADQIDATPGWERLAPVPFSTVCFRFAAAADDLANDLNKRIADRVNASGRAFISTTSLRGRTSLRAAIGNMATGRTHVEQLWRQLQQAAAELTNA